VYRAGDSTAVALVGVPLMVKAFENVFLAVVGDAVALVGVRHIRPPFVAAFTIDDANARPVVDWPQARGASVVLRESLGRLAAADCCDMVLVVGILFVFLGAEVIAVGDVITCVGAARWQVDDEGDIGEEA
jgi:hypothetical protein